MAKTVDEMFIRFTTEQDMEIVKRFRAIVPSRRLNATVKLAIADYVRKNEGKIN